MNNLVKIFRKRCVELNFCLHLGIQPLRAANKNINGIKSTGWT